MASRDRLISVTIDLNSPLCALLSARFESSKENALSTNM